MNPVEQNLANWRTSLMPRISIAGLLSRNPIAYKWNAPFRCWMLREAVLWRITDLLTQSYALHQQGHGLGAQILLRSAIETLATLIYLNQTTAQVLEGKLNFHLFGEKTSILLGGSRDGSTKFAALNIVTVLGKCDKRYNGLLKLYGFLSESAHPNHKGLCIGYSKFDHDANEANFSNRWMELYGGRHLDAMEMYMGLFQYEYSDVWPGMIVKLESWIVENDAHLEATKGTPLAR